MTAGERRDGAVRALRTELAALPTTAVPREYAARWAAALAAEAGPGEGPAPLPARASRVRLLARAGPALAAAALLGVLLATGALWRLPGPPAGGDLAAAARAALGAPDAGVLADAGRRAGCLSAVRAPGVDPSAVLLGGGRVQLRGRPGVLLVLTSRGRGVVHVVVVDPGCGPAGGTLLGSTTTDGR